jgi:hypothetical protein
MRTVRNITVAVEPELYRQTHRIAAEYDTTVTDMVRFLLLVLPDAVKDARYPGGRPQFGLAAARAAASAKPAPPAIDIPSPSEKIGNSPCKPVQTSNLHSPQRLATEQPATVQNKHFSIAPLKVLISKAFHPFRTERV